MMLRDVADVLLLRRERMLYRQTVHRIQSSLLPQGVASRVLHRGRHDQSRRLLLGESHRTLLKPASLSADSSLQMYRRLRKRCDMEDMLLCRGSSSSLRGKERECQGSVCGPLSPDIGMSCLQNRHLLRHTGTYTPYRVLPQYLSVPEGYTSYLLRYTYPKERSENSAGCLRCMCYRHPLREALRLRNQSIPADPFRRE